MSTTLGIEHLTRAVQTGDAAGVMNGASQSVTRDAEVARAMQENGLQPATSDADAAGKTFSSILRDSVDKVNLYQHQADTAIKELIAGRTKNIHETMLAVERADTSLKLMMQVRNKVLDAYREIMRMQV
jgi:flagellar hook-basal body complex protein FliE